MFDLNIIEKANLIEATISGTISSVNAKEMLEKLTSIIKEINASNCIMDLRKLELKVGIAEVYFFIPKLNDLLSKNIALLVNNDEKEFFDFFETAANNRGLNIKHFCSVDKASEWLKEHE